MTKRVLFEHGGAVHVLIPVMTVGLTLQQIAEKGVPPATAYITVDAENVPTDRIYRNAWALDAGIIKVNAEKAREISLERTRSKRHELLQLEDINYSIADGRGNVPGKVAIEARRQALRDATTPLKDWVPPAPLMSIDDARTTLTPMEL